MTGREQRKGAVSTSDAKRLLTGRVRVTIAGETLEGSAAYWRAVLFDAEARDRIQQVLNAGVKPIVGGEWWVGDNGEAENGESHIR